MWIIYICIIYICPLLWKSAEGFRHTYGRIPSLFYFPSFLRQTPEHICVADVRSEIVDYAGDKD